MQALPLNDVEQPVDHDARRQAREQTPRSRGLREDELGTAAAQATASATTMLLRPSAARAPMLSSTGTAGTGNGICSATTTVARMTYPQWARKARGPSTLLTMRCNDNGLRAILRSRGSPCHRWRR